MVTDNIFTEIETVLKTGLEDPAQVSLESAAVPVRIVTPDPDLVELTLPVTTLQLVDIRRGLDRMNNEFLVDKDLTAGMATVRWPDQPFDLFYTVRGHTDSARDDRLLLGQYIQFIDAHPVLTLTSGATAYLARNLTFRDLSRARDFERALTFTVKTRIPATIEELVPLAVEHGLQVTGMIG